MKKKSIMYTINKGVCSFGLASVLLLSGCGKKEEVINKNNSPEVEVAVEAEQLAEKQNVKITIEATNIEQLNAALSALETDLDTITENYCITELEIINNSKEYYVTEDTNRLRHIIEACPQLTSLRIDCIDLRDINVECIGNLASLTDLRLYFTYIKDLSFLESLTNLKKLDITGNEISDIDFLSALTNLESLNISFNNIEDISVIKSLPFLTYLNTFSNPLNSSLIGWYCSGDEIRDLIIIIDSVKNEGYVLKFVDDEVE